MFTPQPLPLHNSSLPNPSLPNPSHLPNPPTPQPLPHFTSQPFTPIILMMGGSDVRTVSTSSFSPISSSPWSPQTWRKRWPTLTTRTLKECSLASDTGVLMDQGRGGDQDQHDPAPEDLEEPDHGHLGEADPCQHKSIVEGVHSLSFNVQQEVMMRNHMTATLQDKLLNNDIATVHTGDILSTLITLEKVRRQWTWHHSPYSALILIRALWVLNRFNDSSWSCL